MIDYVSIDSWVNEQKTSGEWFNCGKEMVGVRCIQTTIRINQPFRPIGISDTNFQSKCDSLMVIDGLGKGEHKEVFLETEAP